MMIVAIFQAWCWFPPPPGLAFFSVGRKRFPPIMRRNMKALAFAKNALIVLCGPAGCGKSYFAHKYFRASQIVSSDQCREMISDDPGNQRVSPDAFELMSRIIEYRLKFNRLTVADATHLVSAYRRNMIELARKYNCPVYLVVFETDLDTCAQNNAVRPRKVEPEVIAGHLEKFQLTKDQIRSEPYQEIYFLQPQEINDLQLEFC
jgi:predicted kinase